MPDEARLSEFQENELRRGQERVPLMVFVADAASEEALREGLGEALLPGSVFRRGTIGSAIGMMARLPSPQALIIDISGTDQPLNALNDLAEVVEPSTRVLVIGEETGINFYRSLTRSLGVLEYLYKPLTRDVVARHFLPHLIGMEVVPEGNRGGRLMTISAVRGGAGATTIAAHLAWYFGVRSRRHTMVLDADLNFGSAALFLDGKPSSGLVAALEAPQRIDDLFLERASHPVSARLSLMAAEVPPNVLPKYAEGAAEKLVEALTRRYNFVIADVPPLPLAFNQDLLALAHQRIFILPPTLAGIRDTLRLLALPRSMRQTGRPILVVNRLGAPNSLSRSQIEEALQQKIDVVIPDLPRRLNQALDLGQPDYGLHGKFETAIRELAIQVASLRVDETSFLRRGWSRLFGWLK
jgi:pilus assembly protein CpaE